MTREGRGSGRLARATGLDWLEWTLFALVLAALALELRLVLHLNINWDEFHFLSRIYEHRRGTLAYPFQTFHVHLFAWLPRASPNEVDQVLAARVALYVLGIGTRLLLYTLGRLVATRVESLFAVLAYSSFSYVLHHGASFRFDPLCSFLFLLILALVLVPRRLGGDIVRGTLAGLSLALCLMISLKSLFFLPTIAGALLLAAPLREPARALRLGGAFAGSTLLGFGLLYGLHEASLGAGAEVFDTRSFAQRVGSSFLVLDDPFPQAKYWIQSFYLDGLTWLLLAAGLALCVAGLRNPDGRSRRLLLLCFAIPLATLVAYRNTFPYFYPFILAPAILLCVTPLAEIRERLGSRPGAARLFVALLALGVFGASLRFHWENRDDQTILQREHIELVHELFPLPVPYIDRCAMVSSYPKAGMFMSAWGLEEYHARGKPVMRDVIVRDEPLFLIANAPALNWTEEALAQPPRGERLLLPADARILQENYIWHWGRLSVAGKRFEFGAAVRPRRFTLLVPGTYTVESKVPVRIDGVSHPPRAAVELQAGPHELAPASGPARVALRYGVNMRRPQRAPTDQPFFRNFLYSWVADW